MRADCKTFAGSRRTAIADVVNLGENFDEGAEGKEPSHDTLIVSEKEETLLAVRGEEEGKRQIGGHARIRQRQPVRRPEEAS